MATLTGELIGIDVSEYTDTDVKAMAHVYVHRSLTRGAPQSTKTTTFYARVHFDLSPGTTRPVNVYLKNQRGNTVYSTVFDNYRKCALELLSFITGVELEDGKVLTDQEVETITQAFRDHSATTWRGPDYWEPYLRK